MSSCIPPVPAAFVPNMRPRPTLPLSYEALSPRHLEQYRAFLKWQESESEDGRPQLDPDVEAFIRRRDSFESDLKQWKREEEIERVIQWAAYFQAHQSPALRVLEVATPLLAAMLANPTYHAVKTRDLVHDATNMARELIEASGVPTP